MGRRKTVVVGIDFSDYSRNALYQALRVAQYRHAELRLVHIIQPSLSSELAEAYAIESVNRWDDLRRMTEDRIRSQCRIVRQAQETGGGLMTDTLMHIDVLFGNAFVHLLRALRDFNAELLVLGSNGSSDPASGPGELATKCLRKAPIEVMLVGPKGNRPFSRIMACVGYSDACRVVAEQAIHIARQESAELKVFHLYGEAEQVAVSMQSGLADQHRAGAGPTERLESHLRGFLPPFSAQMRGLQMKVQPQSTLEYREDIQREVDEWQPDLVVLATRGRTSMKEATEATSVESIFRHAQCSVLVIKPPDFEYEVGGVSRWR